MTAFVLLVIGLALAFAGAAFIYRPPRRPVWAFACFLVAAMVLVVSFWSASTVGSDDNSIPTVTPTAPVVD
jgi:hypothetical protein